MFGYITPRMDALSETQQQRYRSVYCGLCRELGRLSGQRGRALLSHDMTFLALLLSSLTEPDEAAKEFRCPVHPIQKRLQVQNEAISYAAAMNLVLMDLKCEDQIRDEHSRAAETVKQRIQPAMEKIKKQYSRQTAQARGALEQLWMEETRPHPDPDRLCNLSGTMLGAVFVPNSDLTPWDVHLRVLGEGLGRFVYWMDAWDDRERDHRKRRFNPIDCLEIQGEPDSYIREILEMLIAEAVTAFEVLPLEQDLDLLRNVLYSGVWQRYEAVHNRREKEREE